MDKFLLVIKNILLIISVVLLELFIKEFYFATFQLFLFKILLLIVLFLSIKDLIQKNNIGNKYNILSIVSFVFISFIFLRSLYDPSFIYNSKYYIGTAFNSYKDINFYYTIQNMPYLITMLALLIGYREINIKKIEHSKYSKITMICLLLSVGSIIPTIIYFDEIFSFNNIPVVYLLFNILLLITEIVELIRNNGKKREWPIYLCFLFNLFAFISIFT